MSRKRELFAYNLYKFRIIKYINPRFEPSYDEPALGPNEIIDGQKMIGILEVTKSDMIKGNKKAVSKKLSDLFKTEVHTWLPWGDDQAFRIRTETIYNKRNLAIGELTFMGAR